MKINRKQHTKLSQFFFVVVVCFAFLFLFYTDCQFILIVKQHLQKHFVLDFQMCSFVFKLFKKQQKTKIQRTLLSCLRAHLFSTTQYIKTYKKKQGRGDS